MTSRLSVCSTQTPLQRLLAKNGTDESSKRTHQLFSERSAGEGRTEHRPSSLKTVPNLEGPLLNTTTETKKKEKKKVQRGEAVINCSLN